MFHCVSLQIHMDNKQTAKGFFETYDPMNKGYVNQRDFILILQGLYKIMSLPEDIRSIAKDFIIIDDIEKENTEEVKQPENVSVKEDSLIRIDYKNFLKAVTRPFIYQVAKDYSAISVIDLLSLIHE
jgi:hypothetical protein